MLGFQKHALVVPKIAPKGTHVDLAVPLARSRPQRGWLLLPSSRQISTALPVLVCDPDALVASEVNLASYATCEVAVGTTIGATFAVCHRMLERFRNGLTWYSAVCCISICLRDLGVGAGT